MILCGLVDLCGRESNQGDGDEERDEEYSQGSEGEGVEHEPGQQLVRPVAGDREEQQQVGEKEQKQENQFSKDRLLPRRRDQPLSDLERKDESLFTV